MAHFAQIDKNNIVRGVIVVDNKDLGGLEFPESEVIGRQFISNVVKLSGTWVQTSYNKTFRKNYASPGMIYDSSYDAFYYPYPPESGMVLDKETFQWIKP